jgi:Stigma-specific protein, Stig1
VGPYNEFEMIPLRRVAWSFVSGAFLFACSSDNFVSSTNNDAGLEGAVSDSGRESGCPGAQCGDVCIDTDTDNANCGKCGNVCPAFATCTKGACVCDKGKRCGNKCVDVLVDPDNCGQCGFKCGGDGGISTSFDCVLGHCKAGCGQEQTSCNGVCYDLQTTAEHCGTCDNDCTVSGQSCCGGKCVALLSDQNNCGQCGLACSAGSCTSGKCCNTPSIGTCSHDLCASGNKLSNSCDPDGCVAAICSVDSFCCTTSWDSICVGRVATSCSGKTCTCK